jgi:hypothetical protein
MLWFVFSARYPMAFDENYHYGIIQQYAKQWSPFFSSPPSGTEAFGDITRYPSYLFHYLLSFPYRLLSLFTDSDTTKIVLLRLLNVGMLASSLVLFKKLFKEMRLSSALANLSMLVFILIPVVPFLGAQINYDNAVIPLTALTLIAATYIIRFLKEGSLSIRWFAVLTITGMFTMLIKYAYAPIFVAVFVYILVLYVRFYVKHKARFIASFKNDYASLSRVKRVCIALGFAVGFALCVERYGVNIVTYKNPVPRCEQVLSEASCMSYGPWRRDYNLKKQQVSETPTWRIVDYNAVWVQTMLKEFYFAINHNYANGPPLQVLFVFARGALVLGLVVSLIFIKQILGNRFLRLIIAVSIFYVITLWLDNYRSFYAVHWPVAIHGRYVLPLVPAMVIVMGYAINLALQKISGTPQAWRNAQLIAATALIAGVSFGGGTLTFIARSSPGWYWQNSKVIQLNSAVKNVITKVLK